MSEAELGILATLNGAQVAVILIIICFVGGFILSKYPKIKELITNWYNRKKKQDEILEIILKSKNEIEELQKSDKEDKEAIAKLHDELTTSMNKVFNALDDLKKNQKESDEKRLEDNAIQSRVRILRTAEDIRMAGNELEKLPSRESFRQAMSDIDKYEKYCDEHPLFVNNFTVMSIKKIKDAFSNLPNDHF